MEPPLVEFGSRCANLCGIYLYCITCPTLSIVIGMALLDQELAYDHTASRLHSPTYHRFHRRRRVIRCCYLLASWKNRLGDGLAILGGAGI